MDTVLLVRERDPVDVHLGNRLRRIRTANRISLEETGRRIGVTYQQVQKYETGANRISAATLYRLAQVFETTVMYFYEGLSDAEGDGSPADPEARRSLAALGRVVNPDVRHRLRELIDTLGTVG